MSIIKFFIVLPSMWFGLSSFLHADAALLLAFGFTIATCLPNSKK